MGTRKQFSPEFKREAVQLLEKRESARLRDRSRVGDCPESTQQVADCHALIIQRSGRTWWAPDGSSVCTCFALNLGILLVSNREEDGVGFHYNFLH